mmetsp:Transcript_53615/g.96336  ORF Transcript_53615/g.96336 Transcript_53615/m.96336 type:complete len:381 (+) Transcript_53615:138-1280(+)
MAERRRQRFSRVLEAEPVDRKALAELTWSGVPAGLSRSEVWQLLLGYRPLAHERCRESLHKKRQEYFALRRSFYDDSPAVAAAAAASPGSPVSESSSSLATSNGAGNDADAKLLAQLRKDLRRTTLNCSEGSPAKSLVKDPRLQTLMERVLFVWAVRQPAIGYVQGFDDLLLVLVVVTLTDRTGCTLDRLGIEPLESLSEDDLREMEADCYWCAVKILSEIFDHYTQDFPGLQRMGQQLKEVLRRIDGPLLNHLEKHGVDVFQIAFSWMATLMVRDLPIACCIRLWDTLIAESAVASGQHRLGNSESRSAGFEVFLVYFCACFTAYFSTRIQEMDLDATIRFMSKVPTDNLSEADLEVLLSEAFVLKSLFQHAPQHLNPH